MLAGLSEWLDAFGRAWEARDAQAASELFSDNALYQWGPFATRLRGPVMIREAFAEQLEAAGSTTFSYEVLTASNSGGLARWSATIGQTTLEGIIKLTFDDTGLCSNLKAWWNAAP